MWHQAFALFTHVFGISQSKGSFTPKAKVGPIWVVRLIGVARWLILRPKILNLFLHFGRFFHKLI
jgi:hypothetical protein